MCSPLPSSARRSAVPALTVLVALLLTSWAGTALAHSDEGEMEITRLEQRGPGTIELEVGVVYANDDHQADGASVTVILTGPDGATVGPVELVPASDAGSLFAATIDLTAGTWTAQVTSTDPDATADGSIEVSGETEQTTTTSAASTTEAPTTTEQPDVGALDATDGEAAATEGTDGGGSTGLLVAAAVVAVAVLGGGAYLASRRRGTEGDPIE